ncbi:hypothetical protein [Helicobacter felis]|uniref:hypothetical protein n=1 Tax=Helicobacter felis TaxID=214 RepID=UPI000CEEAED0|nr:hypothetical protein [Helicobacter felis]
MPLPLIIGGVVLGAIIGGIVIIGIKEFLEKIKKRKEKEKVEAKITSKVAKGEYKEVNVGLYKNGRKIDSETYNLNNDDADDLEEGMTI